MGGARAVHLRQFSEHGLLPFLWKYLVESARVGYYHNKYEVEAREEARRVVLATPGHVLRPCPCIPSPKLRRCRGSPAVAIH